MPPYGPSLNLDTARKVVAAAEAEARKNNWNVVISIVDTGGHVVLVQRLDGTQYGSVDIAIKKAQTATAYRRPTKVFEDRIKAGDAQLTLLPGVMPLEGGVPIVVNGQLVGGIGVSGVTAAQDGQIAKAGADVVAK